MSNIKKAVQTEYEKVQTYKPRNEREKLLIQAFLQLEDKQQVADFLRDMLTTAEIEEFANRIEIARLLKSGTASYQKIAAEIGTSTTTVTRVAQWLFRGCGGYWNVLQKLKK